MSDEFLSKLLQQYIRELNLDEGTEEDKEFRNSLQKTFGSLEGFADEEQKFMLEGWKRYPGWEAVVDGFYCREALAKIPAIVERLSKLSPVLAVVIPNEEVSVYLSEATRSFIFGFFQASIVLCRAAVEAGLNDHLRRKLLVLPTLDLAEKIDAAERFRLIPPDTAQFAHAVREEANNVLHRKPAKETVAFDTLVRSRGFLGELFKKQ